MARREIGRRSETVACSEDVTLLKSSLHFSEIPATATGRPKASRMSCMMLFSFAAPSASQASCLYCPYCLYLNAEPTHILWIR